MTKKNTRGKEVGNQHGVQGNNVQSIVHIHIIKGLSEQTCLEVGLEAGKLVGIVNIKGERQVKAQGAAKRNG